jgi:hypothetical protein
LTKLKKTSNCLAREEKAHANQAKARLLRATQSQRTLLRGSKFRERFLLAEERAQAEAVFRLMIDSVIGLAILLVILSALQYFQGQVVVQSKADLISLVQNAVNTPTGIVLKSGELTFPNKFSIDGVDLQTWTNLSANCFKFNSRGSIMLSDDEQKIEFTQSLKTIVYAQCFTQVGCDPYTVPDDWSSCCNQCTVSFGVPISID